MCGRTACTLAPDEICNSCRYPSRSSSNNAGGNGYKAPQWRDHPGTRQYTPSHNMAPSVFSPVMIMDQQVQGVKRGNDGEEKDPQRIIQPMMWGLIPHYYKGSSASGHGLKTNNCRVESVQEKKLFLPPLKNGRRCVVLCDGFYEWQSSKSSKTKQPYFIYAPQSKQYPIWDRKSWNTDEISLDKDGTYHGPELLKMAGLYSKWVSEEGDEVMSYTVLTMESGKKFGELHHRIPAILDNEEKINEWLDPKLGYEEALNTLSNDPDIEWHPVASFVNNSRNNDSTCTNPIDPNEKPPETAGSKLMSSWLKSASKPSSQQEKRKNSPKSKPKQPGLSDWLEKSSNDSTSCTK